MQSNEIEREMELEFLLQKLIRQYATEQPTEWERICTRHRVLKDADLRHQIAEVGIATFGLEGRILREFEQD